MVDSSIPVTEDQVGAIITLVKLAHERRGYADTQWHEIQAGHVGLATTARIYMNPPMPIRCPVSVCCRVAAFKQQKTEAFYLTEQDVSTGNFDHLPQDRPESLY